MGLIFSERTRKEQKSFSQSASEGRRGRSEQLAYFDEPILLLSVLADVDGVGVVRGTRVGGFELFEEDGHLCSKGKEGRWRGRR